MDSIAAIWNSLWDNLFWQNVSSIATSIGVLLILYQIWQSRKIAQASFEDSVDREYRELVKDIPMDALVGKPLTNERQSEARELAYNYLDLCNEQVFLRKNGRVSATRWSDWAEGIQQNIKKPLFHDVWRDVMYNAPETFTGLVRLVEAGFKEDPRDW